MRGKLRSFFRKTANAMTASAALACLGAAAVPAGSDEILLKNGGRITGMIVERTASRVVIESGPGRVTLPMSRVERVVESRSSLEAWQEKASALGPGDLDGWAALARWAVERELATQSRECWLRVLALSPDHPEANAAIGRERLDGQWLERDDAYRARGFVQFEGRWLTPAEHEAALRERATESAEARERREAELRVREAEARAREAEARARDAEQQPVELENGGLPYGWGGNAGAWPPPAVDRGSNGDDHRGDHGHDRGHSTPEPSSTPPSSINGPGQGNAPAPPKSGGVSAPKPRN